MDLITTIGKSGKQKNFDLKEMHYHALNTLNPKAKKGIDISGFMVPTNQMYTAGILHLKSSSNCTETTTMIQYKMCKRVTLGESLDKQVIVTYL